MKLDIHEIEFDHTSYADPNGRLFHWNGEIYRAVPNEISSLYSALLTDKRFKKLFDSGLIETELSSLELEGFGIVLKHRKIDFVSFGFEWCGKMLQDAAILVLDLNLRLNDFGLELHDANPWNVLFDGCVPKYVDFGSIVPIAKTSRSWSAYEEFVKSFLNPLLLTSVGKGYIAREMMSDWRKWGVPNEDVFQHLPKRKKYLHKFLTKLSSLRTDRIPTIHRLKKKTKRFNFKIKQSEWTDYYKDYVSINKPEEWTPKQKVAFEVLSRFKPETVLDIGSNTGWFSELASNNNCSVVALDRDEGCVEMLYERFQGTSKVLPLIFDFKNPSPPHGPADKQFAGATERLRCDLVLALGVTHHLVFKEGMGFKSIADVLQKFTKSTLLVEFVPKEDRYVSEWYNDSYNWYNLENFVLELKRGFSQINVLPSNRPPRSLLLCEGVKNGSD
jgi:hypothetical protein